MKTLALCCFLLNTMLWATFYAVSKEALTRIDNFVFSFLEVGSLLPAVTVILYVSWRRERAAFTRRLVLRGVKLGGVLALAIFTSTLALKHTTATNTAFFPSLNGIMAALIARGLLKRPIAAATWIAGLVASAGALLLIFEVPINGAHWRGDLIALLAAFFYTCYIFQVDHDIHQEDSSPWPLFGIELATMIVLTGLGAALLGDWSAVHPVFPKDIFVVLYIGFGTTLLPTAISIFMQKRVSPVTVAFIYVFEPIWSALLARLYLGEALTLRGYLGGALIISGALMHTWHAVKPADSALAEA
ncbi:DMT family transporter [Sorangium sp. So ce1128]